MDETVKIYTADECWKHIFTDLGMVVVDAPNVADVNFDDIETPNPISVDELKHIVFSHLDNQDIITDVFGRYVVLPNLQQKIIICLYKNPDISMNELKTNLGFLPDMTTHAVENAIYQLRKNYGHDFILNSKGKYKLGHI